MMSRCTGALVAAALLWAFVAMCVRQAYREPTHAADEPLWFMRSTVCPADLSTETYRAWAIDVPAMNRWVYWAVLKLRGEDVVPPGEPNPWSIKDGKGYFEGRYLPFRVEVVTPEYLADYAARQGPRSPRQAIVTMRMTNIAVFAACLAALWLTARMALASTWWATVAVLPLMLSPVFATDVAFISWSGDTFLLMWLSAMLAAWTWFHLRGKGTTPAAVIVVSVLAGLAASSKHPGVLAAVAFSMYLAWQSKGRNRLINPLAALATAFAAFAALNWVIFFYPGAGPWTVCRMMIERRGVVLAEHVRQAGGLSLTRVFKGLFFWWPILPLGVLATWTCRREKWFGSIAVWGAVLVAGHIAGVFEMPFAVPRYLAPLEMGLFFPVSVAVIALIQRYSGGRGAGIEVQSPGPASTRDAM